MKTKNLIKATMLLASLTGIVFFSSCKKETKDEIKNEETREVDVRMTDAPASFASFDVEIQSVDIYIDGAGWTNLSSQTQSINVLSLQNGKSVSIGNNTSFKSGNYTKVRIQFGNQYELRTYTEGDLGVIDFTSSTKAQARWEGPKAIEIELGSDIQADAKMEILLDFDVAKSVKKEALEYVIKPAIKCIRDTKTGMQGEIAGAAKAHIQIDGASYSTSTGIDSEGKFKVSGLAEGSYNVSIEYYSSGQVAYQPPKKLNFENVHVAKGEIKNMGTIQCE